MQSGLPPGESMEILALSQLNALEELRLSHSCLIPKLLIFVVHLKMTALAEQKGMCILKSETSLLILWNAM